MNPDYPSEIKWGPWHLVQTEPHGKEPVRYQAQMGADVVLWKWNDTRWGAKVDGASYSAEDTYYDALLSAIEEAIDHHEYRWGVLRSILAEGDP